MRGSIRRRLLALAVGIGGGLAALSPVGSYLEDVQGLDLLFAARGTLTAPPGVAVVALHGDGIAELAERPPRWEGPIGACALRYPGLAQLSNQGSASGLPRELHACLIDVLTAAGAAAIAFDVVFQDDPGRSAGTRALADAAARSGRVVLVRKVEDLTQSHRIRRLDPHLEDAGLPTASFVLDHDTARVVRFWTRHPGLAPPHDVQLALRTLEVVAGRPHEGVSPLDRGADGMVTAASPPAGRRLITAGLDGDADPARQAAQAAIDAADRPPGERLFNLYGFPGTIVSHSIADVLLGRLDPAQLRAAFAGRAVFVGLQELQQTNRVDTFDTAFTRDGIKLSGVELGATAYANLLDGTALRRPPPLADGLMVAGLGVALTASAAWAVPVAGLVLSGAIALAWAALCASAFAQQHLVLPLAVPLLVVLPLALGGGLMLRYQRACDGVRAAVPRPAAERLLRRGLDGLEERPFEATVMMTDVAGWSRLADRHGHDHAHRLLNELFGLLTPIVGAERGLVLNFVADAMTAYWPAQGDPATAAERACRAALGIERALARANERFTMGGEPPLRLRIGVNAGIVSAGATGAIDRTSYALVGETMNTTQRIERLGKLLGDAGSDVVILIADGVRRRLGPGFVTRDLGPHPVPGRDQPVHVHRLLARPARPARSAQLPAAALLASLVCGAAQAQERCPDGAAPAALVRSAADGVTVAGRPLDTELLPEAPVCAGEAIAVPVGGRAEVRLASSRTEVRLDAGTRVVPIAAGADTPTRGFAVRLLEGAIYLLSRTPSRLSVETPFVTAGIDGTEVLLRVDPASRRTDLLVLEGTVAVAPDLVGRRLVTGQRLTLIGTTGTVTDLASPGSAFGDPRAVTADALAWTLFYPDILVGTADPGVARAARLLASGRALEAAAALDAAPASGDRDALRAIIALTRRDVAAARPLVASARGRDPGSATALLAESYLRQQDLDLDAALTAADAAARSAPMSGLARARLAELRLMRGETRAARAAAAEAARLGSDPLVAIVQGYTSLAAYDTRTAESAFRTAIRAESQNPLALLGLGLARIRRGDLEAGRAFLEAATVHDPTSALLRSYLGRAYFEERRDDVAGLQYDIAKQLDPKDPTPWYFDAIRKQLANRPVEALRDVERSIALNDNRAPFRSRLLLDQDQAARGVSLARIYDDLAFTVSGREQAIRSLSSDPASAAAHRLLADLYRDEPRLQAAGVSELLQAQLLSPSLDAPIRPSLSFPDLDLARSDGALRTGFGEYSGLFSTDGIQAVLLGQLGSDYTGGEEAAVAAKSGRIGLSAGQFIYDSDGFRPNADLHHRIWQVTSQANVSEQLSLQGEVRRRDTRRGDRQLYAEFDDQIALGIDPVQQYERVSIEEEVLRLGAHWRLSSSTSVLVSALLNDRTDQTDNFSIFDGSSAETKLDSSGRQLEVAALSRLPIGNLLFGGGVGRVDAKNRRSIETGDETLDLPTTDFDIDSRYPFGQLNINMSSWLEVQMRMGVDEVDTGVAASTVPTPGIGILVTPSPDWALRAAATRSVKRPIIVDQTLSPTQLAGTNIVFDEVDGTTIDQIDVSIQYKIDPKVYVGAYGNYREYSRERTQPDESDVVGSDTIYLSASDREAGAYLYSSLSDEIALSVAARSARYEARWSETEGAPLRIQTLSFPASAAYFAPSGWFAKVAASLVHQRTEKAETLLAEKEQFSGSDSGLLLDVEGGYRIPSRRGAIRVGVTNLLGRDLAYTDDQFRQDDQLVQATDFAPLFVPERLFFVVLQLSL